MNPLKFGHVKISLEEMKHVILVQMSVLMKRNVLMNANMLIGLENVPLCLILFLALAVNGVRVRIESGLKKVDYLAIFLSKILPDLWYEL